MRARIASLAVSLTVFFGLNVPPCFGDELIVSSYFGNSVKRFDPKTGEFLGAYSGGELKGPLGMTLGPDGSLYVCSESNNSIVRFDLQSHAFKDVFASGGSLDHPTSITFRDSTEALVANFEDSTIARFGSKGFEGRLTQSGFAGLSGPDVGTVVGPDGILYVPGFYSNAIYRFDPRTGAYIDTFIAPKKGGLTQPRTILFRQGMVWVSSDNGNKVLRFTPDGGFIDTFVKSGSGGLKGASGMAFLGNSLLVTSWRNNKVLEYSEADGHFIRPLISNGLSGPTFILRVPMKSPR